MPNNIQTIIDKSRSIGAGSVRFIATRQELEQFLKESLTSMLDDRDKELQQKVGMLRQWLNEDRITDVNRMVTSEQILHWLK